MKQAITFISVQIIAFLLALTPLLAFAQATRGENLGQISNIFGAFINFINDTLIPLVFALALLMFFYGIFKYFIFGIFFSIIMHIVNETQ